MKTQIASGVDGLTMMIMLMYICHYCLIVFVPWLFAGRIYENSNCANYLK